MDRIELKGIHAYGYHGVFPQERRDGQEFACDITAWIDLHPAGYADELSLTVDYGQIATIVHDYLTGEPVQLIETLAYMIGDAIFAQFPAIVGLEVCIHKPCAPLKVKYTDVSVTIRKSRDTQGRRKRRITADASTDESTVQVVQPAPGSTLIRDPKFTDYLVLSLGSNLPYKGMSPADIILASINHIPAVRQVSPLYRTKPWGKIDQPDFYNCIVFADAQVLSLPAWLDLCQLLENAADRQRDELWGERTLDIDLIATTSELTVWKTPDLILPHPLAYERPFVIGPWLALDANGKIWHEGNDEWITLQEIWDNFSEKDKESITSVAIASNEGQNWRWKPVEP